MFSGYYLTLSGAENWMVMPIPRKFSPKCNSICSGESQPSRQGKHKLLPIFKGKKCFKDEPETKCYWWMKQSKAKKYPNIQLWSFVLLSFKDFRCCVWRAATPRCQQFTIFEEVSETEIYRDGKKMLLSPMCSNGTKPSVMNLLYVIETSQCSSLWEEQNSAWDAFLALSVMSRYWVCTKYWLKVPINERKWVRDHKKTSIPVEFFFSVFVCFFPLIHTGWGLESYAVPEIKPRAPACKGCSLVLWAIFLFPSEIF